MSDPAASAPLYPDIDVVEVTAQVARELSDIARVLLAPGSPEQTLAHIVRLTSQTIDRCDQCGVCSAGDTRPVHTSAMLGDLDDLQGSLGEGPCQDALAGQDSVYVDDLADHLGSARWPQFAPAAVLAGMRSVLAYRLFADGTTLGALQMYSTQPRAFSAHDRTIGLIFAAHAGMALDQAQQHASERERSDNLQAALEFRDIIGQAQGILMEREKITADQAFDLLRHSSQYLNRKLRDVAQDLVDTGTTPTPSPQADAEKATPANKRAREMATDGEALARTSASGQPDQAGDVRDMAAGYRDALAEDRDDEAAERDGVAASRDAHSMDVVTPQRSAPSFEAVSDAFDQMHTGSISDRTHAEADRRLAAQDRVDSLADRVASGQDRTLASEQRDTLTHDDLTGALRREQGLFQLEQEIERATRTDGLLCFAFVDVDGLKLVNDTVSHQAGDEILRAVSDALRDQLRPYDSIVRYGGDEFVCALPGLTLREVQVRFEAVNATLAQGAMSASVTTGLAMGLPGDTVTDLIGRADADLRKQREQRHSPGWRQ